MGIQTVAGTTLSISASAPATFNESGYEALTWTNIGEITDGGQHGRTYNLITHNPISTRGTRKFKGSFNEGSKTVQLAIDKADTGQDMARTASTSDSDYSFKVGYPDGSADYFQAKVMSFTTTTAGVDAIISGTMTLEITTNAAGVGIVSVDA